MIRNAVLHLMNDQPMLADLFETPSAVDAGLRCTNLRTLDGKRPVFIGDSGSTFFFPYLHMRFVEIPAQGRSGGAPTPAGDVAGSAVTLPPPAPEAEPDLEIDEDFLRRIREV